MGHLVRRTRVVVATQVTDSASIENEDDIVLVIPLQAISGDFTLYLPSDPIIGQIHSVAMYDEGYYGVGHTLSLNTYKHRFSNMYNNPGDAWNLTSTGGKMTVVYAEVPAKYNDIPSSSTLNGSRLGLCGTCNITSSGTTSTLTNLNAGLNPLYDYNIKPGDTIAVYNSFGPPVDCMKRRVISVGNSTITTESFGSNYTNLYWQAFINEGLWFPINL